MQASQGFIDWLARPRIICVKVPFAKSTYEKINILQEHYSKKYRAEELKSNTAEIPYFLRAGHKISEIIQNNEIHSEYKKYCKEKAKERCK